MKSPRRNLLKDLGNPDLEGSDAQTGADAVQIAKNIGLTDALSPEVVNAPADILHRKSIRMQVGLAVIGG